MPGSRRRGRGVASTSPPTAPIGPDRSPDGPAVPDHPGDPLRITIDVLSEGFRESLDERLDRLGDAACDDIRKEIAGPPRTPRAPRAWLTLEGPAGVEVSRGASFLADDGRRRATLLRSTRLSGPARAWALPRSGPPVDVTARLIAGDHADPIPSPFGPITSFRIEFEGIEHDGRGVVVPGFLWKLPRILGRRLTSAMIPALGPARLRFLPGPQGWVMFPSRFVPHPDGEAEGPAGPLAVEVALTIGASEFRHLQGTLVVGGGLARLDPPGGPSPRDESGRQAVRAKVVGPEFGGRPGESPDEWRGRVDGLIRSRCGSWNWTPSDFSAVIEGRYPVRVLDASARVYLDGPIPRDGVCVTIAPRGCRTLDDFLDRAQCWADRIEADLNPRDGFAPPIRVRGPAVAPGGVIPSIENPVSLYGSQVVTGLPFDGRGNRRRACVDGVEVCVYSWREVQAPSP